MPPLGHAPGRGERVGLVEEVVDAVELDWAVRIVEPVALSGDVIARTPQVSAGKFRLQSRPLWQRADLECSQGLAPPSANRTRGATGGGVLTRRWGSPRPGR